MTGYLCLKATAIKETVMIKLIASDVDGTLVKDSSPEIYPEIFPVIKSLKEKGMIIAIASGRQYNSILHMFAPVKDDIIFIAENGAHVRCRDTDMSVVKMDRKDVEEIVTYLRGFDDLQLIVSCPGVMRIETKDPYFVSLLRDRYNNNVEITKDMLDTDMDIIKLAAFRKGSLKELGEGDIIPRFEKKVHCFMAGREWVDFVDFKVDKGRALKELMDFFHITKDETIAFGDNGNDITMLNMAGISYAVSSAPDEVKDAAKYICPDHTKRGVLTELIRIDKGAALPK